MFVFQPSRACHHWPPVRHDLYQCLIHKSLWQGFSESILSQQKTCLAPTACFRALVCALVDHVTASSSFALGGGRYKSAANNASPTGMSIPGPVAASCDVVGYTDPAGEIVGTATTEVTMVEFGSEIVVDVGFGVDTEANRDDESLLLAVDTADDRNNEDLILAKDNEAIADGP